MMWPAVSGSRFSSRKSLRLRPNCAKPGKLLNTASATASSGTTASSVVKVRLPATSAHRVSTKRW